MLFIMAKPRNPKNINPAHEENEDAVHLSPLFGIKPGKYLAALYGAIILLVLFFLLMYPGLTNPGSALAVRSRPRGAAIRIDDVYFAATPSTIFVPKGRHTVTAVLPGFIEKKIEIDAGGRIFGSRFFPKKLELDFSLDESAPFAALIDGAAGFAAWTFAGEPVESRQIPLVLSEGARRSALGIARRTALGAAQRTALAGATESGDGTIERGEDILKAAARFMTTRAALKDLVRAEFFLHSGGLAASPVNMLAGVRGIFRFFGENPAFAVALGDILPEDAANRLIGSPLYPEVWTGGDDRYDAEAGVTPVNAAPRRSVPLATGRFPLSVEGISFSPEFLDARFVQNSAFQHWERTGTFMIALDAITIAQWNAFIRENPEWDAANSAALIEKKLVTEDYLLPLRDYAPPYTDFFAEYPAYPAPAVPGISWFAAKAFCAWLTTKLPPALARDYEVRLPAEAEWEYAAKYAEGYFGPPVPAYAPRRMTDAAISGRNDPGRRGLWEWCDDYFAPLNYLAAPAWAKAALGSPERGVRGGSWVNQSGTVSSDTRGSLAPETCSPFAGFRVVITASVTR
jgi:formylglycine-generating enzyme required for sulfatase activity